MKTASKIRHYLDNQQPEMVDLLKRLIRIETPSLDPSSQAGAFRLLGAALKDVGYRVREIPGSQVGGNAGGTT